MYCNEPNNPWEHPRGYALTPDYYQASYNRVWRQKPDYARLLPAAIDPYNARWGDWRESWGAVLEGLEGADGFAFHAYTHGPELARIWSTQCFEDVPL